MVENIGEQKLGREGDEYMRQERREIGEGRGREVEKGREDMKKEIGRWGIRMENGRTRG